MIHWLKKNLKRWQQVALGCVSVIALVMSIPLGAMWIDTIPPRIDGYWKGLLLAVQVIIGCSYFTFLGMLACAMFDDK